MVTNPQSTMLYPMETCTSYECEGTHPLGNTDGRDCDHYECCHQGPVYSLHDIYKVGPRAAECTEKTSKDYRNKEV